MRCVEFQCECTVIGVLNFVVQVLVTSNPYGIMCLSFVVQGGLATNIPVAPIDIGSRWVVQINTFLSTPKNA